MTTVGLVLAGGTGTRLYPASRPSRPKQLLALGGRESLLARTVARAGFADQRYVITRARYADAVRNHAPGAAVLTEPEPKDTGPALVYATHRVQQQVGECVLVCLPSDHHVTGDFAATARRAARVAADTGRLVAVGVEASRPATGYGYIEPGADRGDFREVARFVEKPDADAAESYVDGGWLWNAGIFAWTPRALVDAARDSPLAPLVEALESGDPERGFATVDPVSIDTAVMERAANAAVVPAGFGWDDLGSWDAVGRVLPTDEAGNATTGEAFARDTEDCVLAAGDDDRVTAVGVADLVVATYDGHTLVVPREDAQRVREIATLVSER